MRKRKVKKSPRRSPKRKPLKHMKSIQRMFPDLTDEIYQTIHEEKIRERKLMKRAQEFKDVQKSRRSSVQMSG